MVRYSLLKQKNLKTLFQLPGFKTPRIRIATVRITSETKRHRQQRQTAKSSGNNDNIPKELISNNQNAQWDI